MSQNMLFSPPEVYAGFQSGSAKSDKKTDRTEKTDSPACTVPPPSAEILRCKLYHHGFIIPSPPPSPKETVDPTPALTTNVLTSDSSSETRQVSRASSATFVARVFDLYRRNPRAMLRNERRWLAYHTSHGSHTSESVRKRATRSQTVIRRPAPATSRPAPAVRPTTKPKTHFFSLGMPNYKPKQSSREHYMHTHSFDVANTPYELLPDFCPPTSTLDKINHPRPLRAEWKGIPLDLSNDPHVDQLHPAEVYLASQLRLPAMVYLDNKRRIFAEYHARKEAGLGFRRTDAQRCARIDVNKASRLWQAFERVGWLD